MSGDLFSPDHEQLQLKHRKKRCLLLHSRSTCLLGTAISLLSCVSLVLSIMALQNSKMKAVEWSYADTAMSQENDENALHQVEVMLEGMGEMTFKYLQKDLPSETEMSDEVNGLPGYRSQRSVDAQTESLCSSSNETNVKPLAHIIGPKTHSRKKLPDDDRFTVLTKQWLCGSESGNQGMVHGGMVFHRFTGFLELPVAGVYYVYHQVTFRPSTKELRLGRIRLVSCIPGEDCSYLTSSEDNDPYMQMESDLKGKYGSSKFQGGMFHFPAGAQVAILAWNEVFSDDSLRSLRYNDHGHNTYMGAFLVDGDV